MQSGQAIAVTSVRRHRSDGHETSDVALVGLIANGDRDAMRRLFGRHKERVFRFLLRRVDNEANAEDLLSEVFIEIWRNAGRFEARSEVSTWLLAIARNKAVSTLRRRAPDEADEQELECIEDPADGPEAALQNSERSKLLRDCLGKLSPAHREIIDLIYYHGRTIDDAARIIGIPLNTVKTRMFHARKRIGEMLAARGLQRAFV